MVNGTLNLNDSNKLKLSLGAIPKGSQSATLIILSGLPGTGKSYFSKHITKNLPDSLIIETDLMRKVLFDKPNYSGPENARLFRACHHLVEDILQNGISVIFDATNLIRKNRRKLYNIADRLGVKIVVVKIEAPEQIIFQRLIQRTINPNETENSSADLSVYEKMKKTVQPIVRSHFIVDTSEDIGKPLKNIIRKIHFEHST